MTTSFGRIALGVGIGMILSLACGTVRGSDDALIAPGAESTAQRSRAIVQALMEEHSIPGMSASVWRDGAIVWSEGLGNCDLEHEVATTRQTRFRYASVSKLITAAVAARLAGRGEIDLDADVRTYVPEFPDKEQAITIRQLLGHLGGVRHYSGKDFDLAQPGGMIDLRMYGSTSDALALFQDDPLIAAPGEEYAYSTFAFTLIAAALEGATGATFLELVEQEVGQSLGLESIGGDHVMQIVPHRTSYFHPYGDPGVGIAPPANNAYKWAGGGLIGTADDLARFGAAHIEPGFIESNLHAEMFTSQRSVDGEETGVGLAWRLAEDDYGREIWHHSGSMGGARSHLMVMPMERLCVALLSNLSSTPRDIAGPVREIAAIFVSDG